MREKIKNMTILEKLVRPDNSKILKRFQDDRHAFTLAEVLITIGIIGVVAAMTIPTLIGKYQKKVTVTQLQKAYTDISNAIIAAQVEHGMMSEWSGLKDSSITANTDFLENYLGNSLKYVKVCIPVTNECFKKNTIGPNGTLDSDINVSYSRAASAITQNGYSIFLWVDTDYIQDGVRTPHAQFRIDLDGPNKGENMIGKDVFGMICFFDKVGDTNAGCYFSGGTLSRDELLNDKTNGCNKKGSGLYCGALIQADGWEIKDDYPW